MWSYLFKDVREVILNCFQWLSHTPHDKVTDLDVLTWLTSSLTICYAICYSFLTLCIFVTSMHRVYVIAAELMTRRVRLQQQQQLLLMNLHLLANPGDSLLLQHTLDRLLRWLCPSLRIFHVSERASPFRSYIRLCPVAGKDPSCGGGLALDIGTSWYTLMVFPWQRYKALLCLYI